MPNTAPKFNGWQSLGIVLSICWMIAVGITCWVELRREPFGPGG
jgi:ribose/xylose/arabinose/galactoside ABC-type transport system permease subunit